MGKAETVDVSQSVIGRAAARHRPDPRAVGILGNRMRIVLAFAICLTLSGQATKAQAVRSPNGNGNM
jgi:hypothetical protein